MGTRYSTNALEMDLPSEAESAGTSRPEGTHDQQLDENLSDPNVPSDGEASGDSDTDEEEKKAGPSMLKPSTVADLAAFEAAQAKAGIVYITRIPPGMRPPKLRRLMSRYGGIGRSFLQQEGE